MNLAYVSPLPPQHSGIADYSAALLPYLRPHCARLVGVVDNGIVPDVPPGVFDAVYDASEPAWWAAERAIPVYHMGNNRTFHRHIYQLLRRFPGVTVLHDGSLLPFINAVTVESGAPADFVRELSYAVGTGGTALAWQHLRGGAAIAPEAYPMLARVCQASLGLIVHSEYMWHKVRSIAPETPVAVIPMLDMTPVNDPSLTPLEARSRLGLAPEEMLLGAFGFIAPTKRLETALHVLAGLRASHLHLRLLCVGEIVEGYDFMARVAAWGLEDIVRVTGYVSPSEFSLYMQAVDVGLNLRYPTWGEMSAALIRLMALSKPVLVTDAASFSDLPDAAVCKIPHGAEEASAIESTLRRLIAEPAWRRSVGDAAGAYVRQHCDPATVARQYVTFIRSVTGMAGVSP